MTVFLALKAQALRLTPWNIALSLPSVTERGKGARIGGAGHNKALISFLPLVKTTVRVEKRPFGIIDRLKHRR
ncbi:MAG: hypothetical protein P4L55_10190 [Syntrophobacteraceae bacterium]|nr:hypothetical protein [Syntrophobacteraceae bacterium]